MELEPYFFDNLCVAKQLWDAGVGSRFFDQCGSYTADTEDYYELFYEGAASVYEKTCNYYNEEKEVETLVLFDPLMNEFFRLCREYERRKEISRENDPFRSQGQREIHDSFGFVDYCCDWWLFDEQHGRPRLVILFDCNFCGHHALPGAIADSRSELENQISRLKKALADLEPQPVITLPAQAELKEAA